jgi:two-component system, LytTR family, response regulator AlgR
MKILICDDEAPARERLRNLLQDIGDEYQVVSEATNGKEAIEQFNQFHPQIILMDIRMPVMDGLEAAIHLNQSDNPPAVIFVTAYDQHAMAAFDANAVDYLLKPIRQTRLEKALKKAKALSQSQVSAIEESHEEISMRSHICANIRGNLRLIPIHEIIYFKAEQKYVTLRTSNLEILIEEPLKDLEQEFETLFTRIHRNALIATDYIQGLEKDNGQCLVRLKGIDDRLEVSRRHSAAVRKVLKNI